MARRQLLKTVNRSSILNVIKARGPIARTDIARLTGLSPATVTGLTAELIEGGLIFEKQEGVSRGGRKPILLALNAAGAYVVGIKLAEEHATLVLTDLNAEIVARHTIELLSRAPEHVSDQLADSVRALLRSAQVDHSRLLGVGIGLAGIIDTAAGVCRMSPHNGWREVPFAALLEERLHYPVYLDNNVNTLVLMERLFGVGQQVEDFLVITVGRGIGLGIVASGQVYRGTRGGGGEFGHIVIDPEGPLCTCGNRGCLETFVAEPWLLQRARLNGLEVTTPDELVAAAEAGHPMAREVFTRAGQIFGRAVANLVNLFNPAIIIISGEGVRAGDFLFGPMRETMERHMFGQLAEDVEVRVEPLGDDAWARGAASLVLRIIFHTPELAGQRVEIS
jgi:N-acetylglucosamine repressor